MPKDKAVAENCGLSEWNRLYVRVTPYSGWSKYRAWTDGGLEFRGTTLGYSQHVDEILSRMIRMPAEPPEVVVKTARMLFEHFEAYVRNVKVLGDDFVGTAVEYKDPDSPYRDFTLYMEMETLQVDIMDRVVVGNEVDLGPNAAGWLVTIKATYDGNDGYGIGKHVVTRKVLFKSRIDTDVVWCELMRTVRRAVNALPTE